ncbi:MAG: hypothetical protein IK054_00800 [Lachnospiraceae bacterium]|nr:hypothetical protein [Lachnospiraceae bacterium]MBR4807157.1 hypothetical protein [Lachnospiraceae bacterium]
MIENLNPIYEKKKKRSRFLRIFTTVATIIVVLAVVYIFVFHLNKVTYSGNSYYTESSLNEMLLSDKMSGNTLYVFFKYNFFYKPDYPYLEKVQVKMLSPSHLQIEIFEKVVIGCVDYMGTYMYFDHEGTVIDSSVMLYEGTPIITGLEFDHVVTGEKLPVEDEKVFKRILEISELLAKNNLRPNSVNFDADGNITLHFEQVRVELGTDKNIKLKISDLPEMLPSLEGKIGVLHMENYSPETDNVTFTEDKEEPSSAAEPSSEAEASSAAAPAAASTAAAPEAASTAAAPASSTAAPASSTAPATSAAPASSAAAN